MSETMLAEIRETFENQIGKAAKIISRISFNCLMIETEDGETYKMAW